MSLRRNAPNTHAQLRAEIDAWAQKVSNVLPDGPMRTMWEDFPIGACPLDFEMSLRLAMLERCVRFLERGGRLEAWDELLRDDA